MKNKWIGQGIEVAQGCPAEEFRLLALDRLVPLLEVLLSVVPLQPEVPLLLEVLLAEVQLWELLDGLPEAPLLVEPGEEVLFVVALMEALGAGLWKGLWDGVLWKGLCSRAAQLVVAVGGPVVWGSGLLWMTLYTGLLLKLWAWAADWLMVAGW